MKHSDILQCVCFAHFSLPFSRWSTCLHGPFRFISRYIMFITPATEGSVSRFESLPYTRCKTWWLFFHKAAAQFPSPYRFRWASGDCNILHITSPGIDDQQLDIDEWRRTVGKGAEELNVTMQEILHLFDMDLDDCRERLPRHIEDRQHLSSFLDDKNAELAPILNEITAEIKSKCEAKLRAGSKGRISPRNKLVKALFEKDQRFQTLFAFVYAATMGYTARCFQILGLLVRPISQTQSPLSAIRNWFWSDGELISGWPEKKGHDRTLRQQAVWLVPPSLARLLVIYFGAFRPFLFDLLNTPGLRRCSDSTTLQPILTHLFVNTDPVHAGRVWIAREYNRALNTSVEILDPSIPVKGLNDKTMRHIFQCTMERFVPSIALGNRFKGQLQGQLRPDVTNDGDVSATVFNLSAGHTSETAGAHYGNTTDTQPHPSQSMSKELYVGFLDIGKVWQVWLHLRELDHDLALRCNLTQPVWMQEKNWMVALCRLRHLTRRMFEPLDFAARAERWKYLESNRPYLNLLDVSLFIRQCWRGRFTHAHLRTVPLQARK